MAGWGQGDVRHEARTQWEPSRDPLGSQPEGGSAWLGLFGFLMMFLLYFIKFLLNFTTFILNLAKLDSIIEFSKIVISTSLLLLFIKFLIKFTTLWVCANTTSSHIFLVNNIRLPLPGVR